jgi:Uncharacterized conserved protein
MKFFAGRTHVAIDGANMAATLRSISLEVDYRRLRTLVEKDCDVLRFAYYTALPDDNEASRIRPLVDFLDYNGYAVATKPTKTQTGADGVRRTKGNMDIEIAVDAMELVPFFDNLVLFSGDGDFAPLVRAVQRKGKRVTVVCTTRGPQPVMADELRRAADRFVDYEEIRAEIARDATSPARAA